MNGNLFDVSGNDNHGIGNFVTLTADQNGVPGEAYLLNGNNAFIEFQDHAHFDPPLPVTITAWVRKDNVGQGKSFLVFSNRFQANTYDGVWLNINAADKITAAYGDGGPVSPGSRRSKTGITSLSPNTWHHVAVVINGPLDMEVYLDGINDCGDYSGSGGPLSTPNGIPGASGVSDLHSQNGPFNYGKGAVNDIRFFNTALSQQEIWEIAFNNSILPSVLANCPPDPCEVINIVPSFSYSAWTSVVTFTDATSSYLGPPDYVVWDFGNGNTQTTMGNASVTHNFFFWGTYHVCMTAGYFVENKECIVTICEDITLTDSGLRQQFESGAQNDIDTHSISWTLYPNPATSMINIDASNIEGKYSFDILDLSGKLIQSHRGLGLTQLKIDTLSKGIYLVILRSNGIRSTKKLYVN
ncbi:MAG: LamG-like jellyroll fold domain-containing protein [Bacteroidota bacterium]